MLGSRYMGGWWALLDVQGWITVPQRCCFVVWDEVATERCHRYTGREVALRYARMRYDDDPEGDTERQKRQQYVIQRPN